MKRKIQWFVFLFAFAAAGHYLIEAESFPETGKWVSGNAGAASGQKFLTAGEKEARAQGDYAFPETGSYYVWVRNLSFSQNWRKCTVAVDGVSSSAVGDEATTLDTPAWIWSRSKKPFYLVKGIHRVTLTATSAAVRTDCILFTTDKEYVPAEGKAPAAGEYGVLLPEGVLRGKLVLDVATDKDALSYRCGEKVTFSLSAKLDGKRLPRGRVVYRLRDDAGTDQTGKFDLGQEGDEVFLETALDRPGFIRLTAELVDEKGRKMRGIDDRGEVSFGHFDGGAGVEPERIPSNPAPDDFDAFWAKQKARLAAVPLRADVKLLDRYSDAEFQTFAVTVDCAGARPATGFLIVPVGAA
ncbi:MAG: hypothetical protein MJ016_08870, partial [Victivallaceae bacterium]|nr:hypothetical protein [Victivallaceae bacterium]